MALIADLPLVPVEPAVVEIVETYIKRTVIPSDPVGDAQLGWIVRIGQRKGVPTPLTRAVIGQIHKIETGARSLDRENMRELGE